MSEASPTDTPSVPQAAVLLGDHPSLRLWVSPNDRIVIWSGRPMPRVFHLPRPDLLVMVAGFRGRRGWRP